MTGKTWTEIEIVCVVPSATTVTWPLDGPGAVPLGAPTWSQSGCFREAPLSQPGV